MSWIMYYFLFSIYIFVSLWLMAFFLFCFQLVIDNFDTVLSYKTGKFTLGLNRILICKSLCNHNLIC